MHSGTKYTIYELVFGKNSKLPTNVLGKTEPVYNFDDYSQELRYRLNEAWKECRKNLIETKIERKKHYDKVIKKCKFKFNDKVMIKNETGNKLSDFFK